MTRILIIDDMPAILNSFQRVLKHHFEVVTINDSRQALDLLRHDTDFMVILCDLLMPELTGMDLFRIVERELPQLAPRFIFMTAGNYLTEAADFLDQIDNRQLAKPISPSQLRQVLEETVSAQLGEPSVSASP